MSHLCDTNPVPLSPYGFFWSTDVYCDKVLVMEVGLALHVFGSETSSTIVIINENV